MRKEIKILTIQGSLLMSILFTELQYIEYKSSNMDMNIYSIFYTLTGLHGIHMIIGEILIIIIMIREWLEITREENILKKIGGINLNFLDICFIIIIFLIYE